MLRRFLAAFALLALLGGIASPAIALAQGEQIEDCCCPKGQCPIVDGQHLCKMGARGKPAPTPNGPVVKSCPGAGSVAEAPSLPPSLEARTHLLLPTLQSALLRPTAGGSLPGVSRVDVPPPRPA